MLDIKENNEYINAQVVKYLVANGFKPKVSSYFKEFHNDKYVLVGYVQLKQNLKSADVGLVWNGDPENKLTGFLSTVRKSFSTKLKSNVSVHPLATNSTLKQFSVHIDDQCDYGYFNTYIKLHSTPQEVFEFIVSLKLYLDEVDVLLEAMYQVGGTRGLPTTYVCKKLTKAAISKELKLFTLYKTIVKPKILKLVR